MNKDVGQYFINLYKDVPSYIYLALLLFFFLVFVLLLLFYGIKKCWRLSMKTLLSEYICLLLCSTVLFRKYNECRKYDFQPFWSYMAIHEGKSQFMIENIMNVVVFVPVGLLLGCAYSNIRWLKVLLIGSGISAVIETLQYFLHRGFSEVDDLMHNTLGCIIGFGIYKSVQCICFKTQRF